ncbi:MAG TPA: Clp1/GlmU family protein [Acidimicrobiia bacterium]|nr:Clp1/GlmU family protein [Acidimicrobiia bacterium]
MADPAHDALARQAAAPGVTMLIGGLDTGKTTMAMDAVHHALAAGHKPVLVDADIGISTVGPPACVGLKVFESESDLDNAHEPDALHFVGAITSSRLVLQQVVATAVMVERARHLGDVIVVDTTAIASGVSGETLKYHKAELCRPDLVIALQRGEEMEPVVGMLRRFLDVEVVTAPTDPSLVPLGPDDRARRRAEAFAQALHPPLERWKVRPTVFAPTLPVGLNLGRLDQVLVGVQDSMGGCLGLGILQVEDETLRVMTNVGEGMSGLRLGSIRIDPDTYEGTVINLRELMFGV